MPPAAHCQAAIPCCRLPQRAWCAAERTGPAGLAASSGDCCPAIVAAASSMEEAPACGRHLPRLLPGQLRMLRCRLGAERRCGAEQGCLAAPVAAAGAHQRLLLLSLQPRCQAAAPCRLMCGQAEASQSTVSPQGPHRAAADDWSGLPAACDAADAQVRVRLWRQLAVAALQRQPQQLQHRRPAGQPCRASQLWALV
jgi:hypothetical protein